MPAPLLSAMFPGAFLGCPAPPRWTGELGTQGVEEWLLGPWGVSTAVGVSPSRSALLGRQRYPLWPRGHPIE